MAVLESVGEHSTASASSPTVSAPVSKQPSSSATTNATHERHSRTPLGAGNATEGPIVHNAAELWTPCPICGFSGLRVRQAR